MRTLIFDSQILTTVQECSEKYRLMFVENIRPTWPAEPLVKGDVLHTGFEAYYKHLKTGLATEQTRNLIHDQGIELAVIAARVAAAKNGIDLDLSEEVIKAMLEYFDFYKFDDIVPIEIEQPFIFNLYEDEDIDLRILYAGKIDLVATAARYQWKPTPFDNKSTSRNQTPSGRSNQFFGYSVALDSSLLVVNRIGFQKTLSATEKFKRIPLSYPKEYREKWVENTIKWGVKLARIIETGEYEENISSCDKYSGCVYKEICESYTPEAKEYKIQSRYITVEPWDVTRLLEIRSDPNEQIIIEPRTEESSSLGLSSGNDENSRDEKRED